MRTGQPSGSEPVLSEQPLNHSRCRTLAVGASDVNYFVIVLRISHHFHEAPGGLQARPNLALRLPCVKGGKHLVDRLRLAVGVHFLAKVISMDPVSPTERGAAI